MKKFSFSLETLLRHRRNTEEKERTALARLHCDVQSEQRRDAEIEQKRMQTLREMAEIGGPASAQQDMALFYPYLDRLRYESEHTRRNIGRLERELQAQRAVVMRASKDKKVIETLKTRKQREYTEELEKDQQKAQDELAVSRFVRRSTR
jgi:flagellar FliJ protein